MSLTTIHSSQGTMGIVVSGRNWGSHMELSALSPNYNPPPHPWVYSGIYDSWSMTSLKWHTCTQFLMGSCSNQRHLQASETKDLIHRETGWIMKPLKAHLKYLQAMRIWVSPKREAYGFLKKGSCFFLSFMQEDTFILVSKVHFWFWK